MNSIKEWISDNLRYLLLIMAILIVLAALFFGVRAMTRGLDESSGGPGASGRTESTESMESRDESDSIVSTISGTDDSSAEDSSSEDSSADASSVEDTSSAESADSSESISEVESKAEDESKTESEGPSKAEKEKSEADAEELIRNYFDAVGEQDLYTVLSLVDSLTDEERASVTNDRTSYSNLEILLKDGVRGNGEDYIAFVSYDYQNETQYVTHHGLSWLYVKRNANGALRIMVQGASDSKVTALADSLMQEEEIAELIAEAQAKAAAADEKEKAAA